MLVEFSVQNFRAFREKETFSMVASSTTGREERGRVARTEFSAVPYVLREACLFGANGSGKSSLVEAMAFMSSFVRHSFRNEAGGGIRGVEPFLFHSKWREKPSEFEAVFIHDDTQYQYGFALTRERVVEEWLFARPASTGRQRQLFTRTYDPKREAYEWDISSVHLKGERDSWKSQTRPDALFLSTAMQLNAEGVKGAYEWLIHSFRVLDPKQLNRFGDSQTGRRSLDQDFKLRVLDFLKEADFSISDFHVKDKKNAIRIETDVLDGPAEHLTFFAAYFKELEADFPSRLVSVFTLRADEEGELVPLSLTKESAGTQSFFELAAPIIDALDNGWTLVVDELNSGLHPLAFQHLIALFCDPKANEHDAQLIFTTHDTSVTERSCIGRDQIWLVEKGDDLAARLKPFSDFKTRDERPFQKGYLQGRYGGVPRIAG